MHFFNIIYEYNAPYPIHYAIVVLSKGNGNMLLQMRPRLKSFQSVIETSGRTLILDKNI